MKCVISGGGSLAAHLDDFYEAAGLPVLVRMLFGISLPLFVYVRDLGRRVLLAHAYLCRCALGSAVLAPPAVHGQRQRVPCRAPGATFRRRACTDAI